MPNTRKRIIAQVVRDDASCLSLSILNLYSHDTGSQDIEEGPEECSRNDKGKGEREGRLPFLNSLGVGVIDPMLPRVGIPSMKMAVGKGRPEDQDKDKAQGTEKALSNVITFTPKPSPIREKISFPGMEELSQW